MNVFFRNYSNPGKVRGEGARGRSSSFVYKMAHHNTQPSIYKEMGSKIESLIC